MKKKILNYLVVVEPDIRTGGEEPCFSIYCPALGLAHSGDSIEEALRNMRALIGFHLRVLRKERTSIPHQHVEDSLVTTLQVPYPSV